MFTIALAGHWAPDDSFASQNEMRVIDYVSKHGIMSRRPQIANRYDEDVRRSLKFVLARCYIGDWFVLYQLLKNTNHYFYK